MLTSEDIKRIRPLKDWVLIEVMLKEEATKEGIILPERAHKLVNYATVIAVGPGRLYHDGKWIPNELKPGDVVYLSNLGRCEPVANEEKRYLMFCAEPLIDGVVDGLGQKV